MNTGATIQCGAAFAQHGAATLDSNFITACQLNECTTGDGGGDGNDQPTGGDDNDGNGTPPTDPTDSCLTIEVSNKTVTSTNKAFSSARLITNREKTFANKAADCGDSSFISGKSSDLLLQFRSATESSFLTEVRSCPDSVCQTSQMTSDKSTLRRLARRMYLLQVNSKKGAINACNVRKLVGPRDPNVHDSDYFYQKLLTAIKGLPNQTFECT